MPYRFQFFSGNNAHPPKVLRFQAEMPIHRCTANTKNNTRCTKRQYMAGPMCWIHTLYNEQLKTKVSHIAGMPPGGKGLFAQDPREAPNAILFRPGDQICPYVGQTITNNQLTQRYGADHTAPYACRKTVNAIEDCGVVRGIGSYANRANNPAHNNGRFVYNGVTHTINIKATKNIRNGVEITCPYGAQYVNGERLYPSDHSTVYHR